MKFTDVFIERPVMATVISILIFITGLYAFSQMGLRQFPKIDTTEITVSTAYPGASPDLIKSFITTPIQQKMAEAEGIDYLTSSSSQGISSIVAHMKLGFPPETALTEVMAKVAEVKSVLPKESEDPSIVKGTGQSVALMYIAYNSNEMTNEQISDYLRRVIQPNLQTIDGVSEAQILGDSTYSMRVWLNPDRLAAMKVTPPDVYTALKNNNIISAAGQTKGKYLLLNIVSNTNLQTAKEFNDIVIKNVDGTLVRMRDVGNVELGKESYDFNIKFNGKTAVFMSISAQPGANPLSTITKVKEKLELLKLQFPPTLEAKTVYDATKYIKESIDEVIETIIIAAFIVILVIFAFLGSMRSMLIPVITIPLSLVGVGMLMLAMDFSINTLTLLAFVLAIGMVVDDAIVVLENIYRHIEEGMSPFDAAIKGTREIASPIISMTLTLAAVYAPIGFITGITGSLFREFAFTLAASVIISGVIALTLSPMMCSRILNANLASDPLVKRVDDFFQRLKSQYQHRLSITLNYRGVTFFLVILIFALIGFMGFTSQSELAPPEDQSALFFQATTPSSTNIDFITQFMNAEGDILAATPQREDYFIVNGMGDQNTGFGGLMLKPWSERKLTQQELQPILQAKLATIPGLQIFIFGLPAIPGSFGGAQIQFVLKSTIPYQQLLEAADNIQKAAMKSGKFTYFAKDLRFDQPTLNIDINKSKAGILGIDMNNVATTLATMLGGNYVNRFDLSGYSYKVIPQVLRQYRSNPDNLLNYYIRTASNDLVPLRNIATMHIENEPSSLATFQQQNSVTLSGMLMPGTTEGTAIQFLQDQAKKLPNTITYDYAGDTRTFVQEGNTLVFAILMGLLVIYLVLAAKFESWRDPLIILFSVPLAVFGAFLPLTFGYSTLNIYSGIGIMTLIGLISKHGILIVEFANQLQAHKNIERLPAVIEAAAIRLRPVLMTTAAMVLGVIPLLFANGAGANARISIGFVIASGMTIGTIFTLFVVPAVYTVLARDHRTQAPH